MIASVCLRGCLLSKALEEQSGKHHYRQINGRTLRLQWDFSAGVNEQNCPISRFQSDKAQSSHIGPAPRIHPTPPTFLPPVTLIAYPHHHQHHPIPDLSLCITDLDDSSITLCVICCYLSPLDCTNSFDLNGFLDQLDPKRLAVLNVRLACVPSIVIASSFVVAVQSESDGEDGTLRC